MESHPILSSKKSIDSQLLAEEEEAGISIGASLFKRTIDVPLFPHWKLNLICRITRLEQIQ